VVGLWYFFVELPTKVLARDRWRWLLPTK